MRSALQQEQRPTQQNAEGRGTELRLQAVGGTELRQRVRGTELRQWAVVSTELRQQALPALGYAAATFRSVSAHLLGNG